MALTRKQLEQICGQLEIDGVLPKGTCARARSGQIKPKVREAQSITHKPTPPGSFLAEPQSGSGKFLSQDPEQTRSGDSKFLSARPRPTAKTRQPTQDPDAPKFLSARPEPIPTKPPPSKKPALEPTRPTSQVFVAAQAPTAKPTHDQGAPKFLSARPELARPTKPAPVAKRPIAKPPPPKKRPMARPIPGDFDPTSFRVPTPPLVVGAMRSGNTMQYPQQMPGTGGGAGFFTGVTAGTYAFPASITVDAKGRVTAITGGTLGDGITWAQTLANSEFSGGSDPTLTEGDTFLSASSTTGNATDFNIETGRSTFAGGTSGDFSPRIGTPGAGGNAGGYVYVGAAGGASTTGDAGDGSGLLAAMGDGGDSTFAGGDGGEGGGYGYVAGAGGDGTGAGDGGNAGQFSWVGRPGGDGTSGGVGTGFTWVCGAAGTGGAVAGAGFSFTASAGSGGGADGDFVFIVDAGTTTYDGDTGLWTYPGSATYSSASPDLTLGDATGSPLLHIDKIDVGEGEIRWEMAGQRRTTFSLDAGETFRIRTYSAADALLSTTSITTTNGLWTYNGAGATYSNDAATVIIGGGGGSPVLWMRKSDGASTSINLAVTTQRRGVIRLDPSENLLFLTYSGADALLSTTTVANATGNWTFPADIDVTSGTIHGESKEYVFSVVGSGGIDSVLATGTNLAFKFDIGVNLTVEEVWIGVKTAPTGSALTVDVNDDGTSLWSATPANRPSISAGSTEDTSGAPDNPTIVAGSDITIDIDAVGSTEPGRDLTVVLRGYVT